MTKFTGLEYLFIAFANCMGYDKWTWEDRIAYGKLHYPRYLNDPTKYTNEAAEPIILVKTASAISDAYAGIPSGYLMNLDATASGLQILACLLECHKTASNVNLINTGKREDVYQKMAQTMSEITGETITKDVIKKPVMTYFYGSQAQPKSIFGEGTTELAAFYDTLAEELPGAVEAMQDLLSLWQSDVLQHHWIMPDGHNAVVKVVEEESKKIEVDELNHATFTHNVYVNKPSEFGISIAANIVHSIDGYVVREMVRRAHEQGFELLTIHDSFWAHPNHMNLVRQNYANILAEIAESNILQDIARQILGDKQVTVTKVGSGLGKLIRQSEYALS